jgi:ketosteroid isomerase-like protein
MSERVRMLRNLLGLALPVVCWTMGCAAVPDSRDGLSEADRSAIVSTTLAYRDAWLANEPAKVMATLTPAAVLMPSGMDAVVGEAAIRQFWWPTGGPPTKITAMEQTVDDVSGDGLIAAVRGHGTLSFVMRINDEDVARSQRSTFLNVLRRQTNGSWLITHRMWSDQR